MLCRSWLLGLVLFLGLFSEAVSAMVVETGSYVGDGTDNRAITGVGFAPEVVILRGVGPSRTALIRTSTLSAGTKELATTAFVFANLIISFDADGFTVSDSPKLNQDEVVFHWIAFADTDDGFAVGTYVGDGANPRAIDISDTSGSPDFQPDYVLLVSEGNSDPGQRFEDGANVNSAVMGFTGPAIFSGSITDLTSSGFTVNAGATNDRRVNDPGESYHYVAWRERAGTSVGTYFGSGGAQSIALPFAPVFVSITRASCCVRTKYHTATQAAGVGTDYGTFAETTNTITLTGSGFDVGIDSNVSAAATHFYLAFGTPPPPAVPALPWAGMAVLAFAITGVTAVRQTIARVSRRS